MDPNPGTFPILSYVMSRLPSFGSTTPISYIHSDIEQAPPSSDDPSSSSSASIVGQMPHLNNPKLLAAMTRAISDVSQARSVLKLIGERPTHEDVDTAKAQMAELEARLSRQMQEIAGLPRPPEIDPDMWRVHLDIREKECKESAEKEKRVYKSLVQLDEMHDSYEKLLNGAEKRLVKLYENAGEEEEDEKGGDEGEDDEVNEQVQGILKEADGKGVERVDLSGKKIKLLPQAFFHIPGLVVLDLSTNLLSVIPDSIGGLQNLEELNIPSNLLVSLPDSIGFLQKLKYLNVSGNKLNALPDSISQCRSLVTLDASFNSLQYLPTNIGYELQNMQKLMIQLNKIRSLPSSICEMKSLRYLDAHFNQLHGLPIAIGKLTNLEFLNLSSNFSDLKELPETFGDLICLRELDLSNNQIHALPDTFSRLQNLSKLNLDQNPIELPPMEIVNQGVVAIKGFMAKRWMDILAEEERKSTHEMQQGQEEGQNGWLNRSTSWLKNVSVNVTDYVGTAIKETMSPRTPRDAFLDQQL